MKTIHITSQDELPQVAGAIIGHIEQRVRRGKPTPAPVAARRPARP